MSIPLVNAGDPLRPLQAISDTSSPEAIRAVAKEMESVFAYELIKAMRQTTESIGNSGYGNGAYMTMFDMELSRLLADRGLGLQDMLVRALEARTHAGASPTLPDAGGELPLPVNGAKQNPEAVLMKVLPSAPGSQVSSSYGLRPDPLTGESKFHYGIDLSAPELSAIHPLQSGTVLFSGEKTGYGNTVIVDHGNGLRTLYAHNSVNLVQPGDVVDPSTVIARVGSTGRSTGPHVHLEVERQGRKIDPAAFPAAG